MTPSDSKRTVAVGDFRFGPDEKAAVLEMISENAVSEGRFVEQFGNEFAKYIGTKHCVPLNSGTSALMLSLASLKYHSRFREKAGESLQVITTPLSYIATANAISTAGFEPVFVDVNLEDFSINADLVAEQAEQGDHFGLLPVHLMGYPCDMDSLSKTARRHDLALIEDSCEAHGSEYRGKKTGSFGLAGCFSFFIAHNIQAGEFGCVTTSDDELTHLMRSMKGNGRRCYCLRSEVNAGKCPHENTGFHPRYIHDYIGYNFKPMEFQAGIGCVQLKKADWIKQKRLENVKYLNDELAPFSGILQLPSYSKEISYLGYPLLVTSPTQSRNRIVLELEKQGVECRPIFSSIPTQQPAYSALAKQYNGKVPNAEFVGNNGFYVGCHQYLEPAVLEYLVNAIKNVLK